MDLHAAIVIPTRREELEVVESSQNLSVEHLRGALPEKFDLLLRGALRSYAFHDSVAPHYTNDDMSAGCKRAAFGGDA
jgi:hypothetical protein